MSVACRRPQRCSLRMITSHHFRGSLAARWEGGCSEEWDTSQVCAALHTAGSSYSKVRRISAARLSTPSFTIIRAR